MVECPEHIGQSYICQLIYEESGQKPKHKQTAKVLIGPAHRIVADEIWCLH